MFSFLNFPFPYFIDFLSRCFLLSSAVVIAHVPTAEDIISKILRFTVPEVHNSSIDFINPLLQGLHLKKASV